MTAPSGGGRPVHQFHSGTAVGDAITNEMLTWQGHLRGLGYESEIFAEHIAGGLAGAILPVERYRPTPGGVLLMHHSMGHDRLDQLLEPQHFLVPVYHNITPLEFIDEPYLRRYAHLGHQQLRRLAGVAEMGIADSNLNRREMLRAGFRSATVVPVKTDFSAMKPPAGAVERTTDWLFVGRVVPSKGQLELVDAFAAAVRACDLGQSLVLIGDSSDRQYIARIEYRAQRHGLAERVKILGKLSDAQLARSYQASGIFVSMSKHEGFGVPLLEAMAAGLPVVAYAVAAVGETLGGAGVAIPAGDSASFVDACIALQTDLDLGERTQVAQRQRLARMEAFDVAGALHCVVEEAIAGKHRPSVQVQGPFETTYSLAVLNRELALALADNTALDVSIYATEGPGDYTPREADLALHPRAAVLYAHSAQVPSPDVVIRQMYPPRVHDSPGALSFQYFGWEESLLPDEYVQAFNKHLDGIGTMSHFVSDLLVNSGVTVPVEVVGVGVRTPTHADAFTVEELASVRSFRIVHISSAFPRKGIDLLLAAYAQHFTGADDVTLLIKTFPNPHNDVRELLERLIAPLADPPHVVWIDRDMSEREIDALYSAASVYVHPARGEGFGLPVAEAMNARVPVIAPASTGLADFVNDDTATTVPFRIEPARTHLSIPGSTWAEPDVDALGRALRAQYENPADPDVARRAERAHELISTRFTWPAVADRFTAFIDRVRRERAALSVAMVSTWNSRCGIAEYASDLAQTAAERWDLQIFAEQGVQPIDQRREEFVVRAWTASPEASVQELLDQLDKSPADIVHVQHNFGFFGLAQLAEIIRRQAPLRPVVVTLHRTEDLETADLEVRLRDIGDDLAAADRLIVHQHEDAERLRALGLSRIEVIPIGARQSDQVSVSEARRLLGMQIPASMPVIASYGFLLPHKGIKELIQAIGVLRDHGQQVALIAVCALHSDPSSATYLQACRDEIHRLHLDDVVRLVTDFLKPEVSHLLLSSADIVVLPYHDSAESSSASLRFAITAGRPVVATDIGIFRDAHDALLLIEAPPDPARIATTLAELWSNSDTLAEYAARARRLAGTSSIGRTVDEHSRVYRQVLDARAR